MLGSAACTATGAILAAREARRLGRGLGDLPRTRMGKGATLRRLISRGNLNAPWGPELINGQLWVGNFGDGRINVYDPGNGTFIGRPKDRFNIPLQFEGLWGLELVDRGLYFTAGIADEEHGIFGVIF